MADSGHIADSGAAPPDHPHPRTGASAPPRPRANTKRTLTTDNFLRTIGNFVASGPVLVRAFVRPRISFALREKIYLAVTAINDCRYCQWGHTHWALAHGVPLEEVNQILGHQAESLEAGNPTEAVAILFAQHYAEHLDQFDQESINNLRKYYSDAQVNEILAHVRFITCTNLSGNTVDAFLGRFRSPDQPVGMFQFVIGAALAPILFVIIVLAKLDRALGIVKLRARWHRARRERHAEPGQPHRGVRD